MRQHEASLRRLTRTIASLGVTANQNLHSDGAQVVAYVATVNVTVNNSIGNEELIHAQK